MKIHITSDEGELLDTLALDDAALFEDPKAPADFGDEVKDAIVQEVKRRRSIRCPRCDKALIPSGCRGHS